MKNAIDIANDNQKEASDPLASVFVSASAGSGKTKLLVDRLLRLMLPLEMVQEDGTKALIEGTDPARILCLTYTNAAASEMAHRLQSRLAYWVSLSDEALGRELNALEVPDTVETRRQARGLFLRVLDLPAGLRIETIHAFCQSLLRRFPLEAVIDPYFKLIDEEENDLIRARSVEKILEETASHAEYLSRQISLQEMLDEILKQLALKIHDFAYILEAWKINPKILKNIYGNILEIKTSHEADLKKEMQYLPHEEILREGFNAALQGADPKKEKQSATLYKYLDWLAVPPQERDIKEWHALLFTADQKIRSFARTVILKKMQEYAPNLIEFLEKEAERQEALREAVRAQELRALNLGLMNFALPVLEYLQKEKSLRAVVDYQDLIIYTRALLRDPGASWVLYKLDGGIDHLLLDEVQDTSLEQWKIAASLTEDFFSGKGREENSPRPRTIFAVGDFKQSIFSFQGAEPEQFLTWRRIFAKRAQEANLLWKEPELHVSFRSVPAILDFVDNVFTSEISSQGVLDMRNQEPLKHISARKEEGGRVELWPLIAKEEEKEKASPWNVPKKNKNLPSAEQKLVDNLIIWIKEKIGTSLQEGAKPLKYGDILILFRKRSRFSSLLMRALKSHHIPVESFLGTELTEHLVVKDLMALCATLLLPQDNLSLATILTSPIGDISDESLMDLMTNNRQEKLLNKGAFLWDILRERHQERAEWRKAWACLSALYRRVDYDTPYRILAQALGAWGIRARLLERLGPEASDPIDALLAEALNYEKEHHASLQGFLHWLERTKKRSKREFENTGDMVRMMTVHGAKGLQARLVILPDVHSGVPKSEALLWADIPQKAPYHASEIPLWVPRQDFRTKIIESYKEKRDKKRLEEENRLFYVALTRASDYLLICGIETSDKKNLDYRWYSQAKNAIGKMAFGEEESFFSSEEKILIYQEKPNFIREENPIISSEKEVISLPSWMGTAPLWEPILAPREEGLTRPLAPSRPDGVEFGELPLARSPLERMKIVHQQKNMTGISAFERRQFAMLKGRLAHRLLQILPDFEAKEREKRALKWLSQGGWGLCDTDITTLTHQVMRVIEDEKLAPLFGKNSAVEQAISGIVQTKEGEKIILGKIDRFALDGETIWLCDYKTDRKPPKNISKIPSHYLKQMAAYYGVLKNIYPNHQIKSFFVWTEFPAISFLSEAVLQEIL